MTPTRAEILKALQALSERYPEMRFGQLVVNVTNWATHIPDGMWDVEDEAFLDAARKHLERRAKDQSDRAEANVGVT
jgi:hypothetical protein